MKKDNFDGQKREQHFPIPLRFLRDGRFLRWLGTTEGKVWLYLCSWVLRGEMRNSFCSYLHKKYYLGKNKLVARWSLQNIANTLELRSVGGISSALKELERKEFIIRYPEMLYGKRVWAYELGTHSGEPHFYEFFHAFTQFTRQIGIIDLNKFM